ncbi:MAG: hypothetical protein WCG95_05285 [bacterium]
MAETLGSLCDKLTIIKLKQFHSLDEKKLNSLCTQEEQLKLEMNCFLDDAISGIIPNENLSFSSNKVFKEEGNNVRCIEGTIGSVFAELANINCELWHEQEKVYDFEKVPMDEKNKVVKKLAILNLERNKCIDKIDINLRENIEKKNK